MKHIFFLGEHRLCFGIGGGGSGAEAAAQKAQSAPDVAAEQQKTPEAQPVTPDTLATETGKRIDNAKKQPENILRGVSFNNVGIVNINVPNDRINEQSLQITEKANAARASSGRAGLDADNSEQANAPRTSKEKSEAKLGDYFDTKIDMVASAQAEADGLQISMPNKMKSGWGNRALNEINTHYQSLPPNEKADYLTHINDKLNAKLNQMGDESTSTIIDGGSGLVRVTKAKPNGQPNGAQEAANKATKGELSPEAAADAAKNIRPGEGVPNDGSTINIATVNGQEKGKEAPNALKTRGEVLEAKMQEAIKNMSNQNLSPEARAVAFMQTIVLFFSSLKLASDGKYDQKLDNSTDKTPNAVSGSKEGPAERVVREELKERGEKQTPKETQDNLDEMKKEKEEQKTNGKTQIDAYDKNITDLTARRTDLLSQQIEAEKAGNKDLSQSLQKDVDAINNLIINSEAEKSKLEKQNQQLEGQIKEIDKKKHAYETGTGKLEKVLKDAQDLLGQKGADAENNISWKKAHYLPADNAIVLEGASQTLLKIVSQHVADGMSGVEVSSAFKSIAIKEDAVQQFEQKMMELGQPKPPDDPGAGSWTEDPGAGSW